MPKPAPPPPPESADDDDDWPGGVEAFRIHLFRKLATVIHRDWEKCGDRACARARACVGVDLACQHIPRPPVSPELEATWMPDLKKALRTRLLELGDSPEDLAP